MTIRGFEGSRVRLVRRFGSLVRWFSGSVVRHLTNLPNLGTRTCRTLEPFELSNGATRLRLSVL